MKKLFVLLMVFGLAFAGLYIPDYSVSSDSFKPGGSGSVTVTVGNTELTAGSSVEISSVTLTVYAPSEIELKKTNIFVGDLDPGSTTLSSIPFEIADGASSGVYLIEVRAIGQYTEYVSGIDTGVNYKTATIPVNVVNSPILSLSSSKRTIYDTDTLDLTITNNGGEAKNVRIAVGGEFSFMGTTEIFIDRIVDEETININLDSRNAQEGAITVPFTITYEDELGNEVTVTKSMPITLKKEKLDLIFTQKSEIVTRKDGSLKMEMKNNGLALQDVKIEIETEGLKLRDVSEIDVGDIPAGGTVEFEETVFPELTPGVNKINITIKWIEENVEKTETRSIPIIVTSDADVSVYMDAKPTPLKSGQEHTLSVLVSNLGSYSIDNVEVEIESDALESLDVSDTQYIGSLENDDFSTVQFTVKVKQLSEGDYPIDVKVRYRDASGEWKERDLITDVTVYDNVGGEGNTTDMLMYLGILVVILAVIVWYFKFRKSEVKPAKK